jgi:hypothetical protein
MFKFRPAFQTLEQRENPSGPDLMDGSGLPAPAPAPAQETPPPAPTGEVAPSNPSTPVG